MILYHGSVAAVENPEIIKREIGRDFGFAFYTTCTEKSLEYLKFESYFECR